MKKQSLLERVMGYMQYFGLHGEQITTIYKIMESLQKRSA